jgi:hypothetical protein
MRSAEEMDLPRAHGRENQAKVIRASGPTL